MAVLVTGVGYLGAALVARLVREGQRVVGLDNGFATDLATVAQLVEVDDFALVRGSVSAPRDVARAFAHGPFDVVYHLAAQASAPAAARRPRYTETTNLTGLRIVLDAVARHAVPRFVYASSLRVYGAGLPAALDETTPYGPQTDLAHLSHVYGEKLLELYAQRHALTTVAVRLGVVYGVGPIMKTAYPYMTVPNKYALQAVRGEPMEIYPGAATPTAFLHLDDACAALQTAAAAPWPAGFHAANAAAEVLTVPEVATLVADACNARRLAVTVRSAVPSAPPSGSNKAVPTSIPPEHRGVEGPVSPACLPISSRAAKPSPDSPQDWGAGGAAHPVVHSRLTPLGWRPTRTLADTVGELVDYFQSTAAP